MRIVKERWKGNAADEIVYEAKFSDGAIVKGIPEDYYSWNWKCTKCGITYNDPFKICKQIKKAVERAIEIAKEKT